VRRRTRGTNKWYKELWEPDLSPMRQPVQFSKRLNRYTFEPVLVTGSLSCENLRSGIIEPGWEPDWESSQHLRTAEHWCDSCCGQCYHTDCWPSFQTTQQVPSTVRAGWKHQVLCTGHYYYLLFGRSGWSVQATIIINFSEDLVEITYGVCNFGWSELATISAPV
jgi:hypothetical protein